MINKFLNPLYSLLSLCYNTVWVIKIMSEKISHILKRLCPLSLKDGILALILLCAGSGFCFLLRIFDKSSLYVTAVFILSVFLTAKLTAGYFFEIAASLLGALISSWFYTYLYFKVSFPILYFIVTFLCMLAIALTTGALRDKAKRYAALRAQTEKERAYSQLLLAVSHDIRTPLTAILGSSSTLLEQGDILSKEERTALVSAIKEDALWLTNMVENLLSITRIDSEDFAKLVKESQPVEELVDESVRAFKKHFPDKTVKVSVPDGLFMVPMDAILIRQVLVNLLENAALHAKTSTETRLIVYRQNTSAVFEISDNGSGIPDELLSCIFDGCTKQAHESGEGTKRNMGIGLQICHTIIKAHGGTITAANKPDGGAVFKFMLPL